MPSFGTIEARGRRIVVYIRITLENAAQRMAQILRNIHLRFHCRCFIVARVYNKTYHQARLVALLFISFARVGQTQVVTYNDCLSRMHSLRKIFEYGKPLSTCQLHVSEQTEIDTMRHCKRTCGPSVCHPAADNCEALSLVLRFLL